MQACPDRSSQEFFFADLKVREADITSVHNALSHADPNLLLDAVLRLDPSWSASPLGIAGQARLVLLDRLMATLEVMYALEPVVDPDLDQVIIPWQDFCTSDDGSAIARGLGSCVLHCNHVHLAQAEAVCFQSVGCSVLRFLEVLDEGVHPLEALEGTGLLDSIQRVSSEPWPHVLGRMVWLPDSLCQLERYAVLASIFWAMTCTGFRSVHGRSGLTSVHSADLSPDISFIAEYVEKMELIADVLNYKNWLDVIRAGEHLCAETQPVISQRL